MKPLDEANLHEAALAHLARYATTQARLRRVLIRRVERWEREGADPEAVAAAKAAIGGVVSRLVAAGAVDDAAFAAARAARLARSGHSRRSIAAHLATHGIDAATIQETGGEEERELASALKLASRRRIGPFRAGGTDDVGRRRELGVLARAGFARDVAEQALGMEREVAEEVLKGLRDGA